MPHRGDLCTGYLTRMHQDTWFDMAAELTRKIYFAGSIRAGRNDAELYSNIVKILKRYGTVLTEHVGNPNMKETGEKHY